MSRFNTNTNYPLIPNANEYILEDKVVSIHSEDRDVIKWPNSSNFEIELPADYLNVNTVKLGNYTFPANYNTFSVSRGNLGMTFKLKTPLFEPKYPVPNPTPPPPTIPNPYSVILQAVHDILLENIDNNYLAIINEGFYSPSQMCTELTNKMNQAVTHHILGHLSPNDRITYMNLQQGGYTQFVVAYNEVTQSLYFGNKSDNFTLTNDSPYYIAQNSLLNSQCSLNYQLPCFLNWGLPANLGFTRCSVSAIASPELPAGSLYPDTYPRFYYGDALNPGDNGYWLQPDPIHNNNVVYSLQAPSKINLMGDSYIYMEINGFNNIDETSPFAINNFTTSTNMNAGVHNAAFAKLAIITTPITQWFDTNADAVKVFYPPAERIRRIRVKLRYHNGELVNFGMFNWAFNLVFSVLVPQKLRSETVFIPSVASISGNSSMYKK